MSPIANAIRWAFHSSLPKIDNPDSKDPVLLKRVNAMLARTTDTKRIERLVKIRGELLKQAGVKEAEQPKPQTQPAKPIAFLP